MPLSYRPMYRTICRSLLDRYSIDTRPTRDRYMLLGYRPRVDCHPIDIDHRPSINENPPIHYRYFTDTWSTFCRQPTDMSAATQLNFDIYPSICRSLLDRHSSYLPHHTHVPFSSVRNAGCQWKEPFKLIPQLNNSFFHTNWKRLRISLFHFFGGKFAPVFPIQVESALGKRSLRALRILRLKGTWKTYIHA